MPTHSGYKVFIPALCLAIVAVLAATFLPFGANNAIGISAAVALIVAYLITKARSLCGRRRNRLMDNVGPVGILPQLLAALGALFTAAGVGTIIAKGVSAIIPDGSRLIAVAVYCIGMALFTIIWATVLLRSASSPWASASPPHHAGSQSCCGRRFGSDGRLLRYPAHSDGGEFSISCGGVA
jgi:uncharacterized membrane protein